MSDRERAIADHLIWFNPLIRIAEMKMNLHAQAVFEEVALGFAVDFTHVRKRLSEDSSL